jgi:hypothetical protein
MYFSSTDRECAASIGGVAEGHAQNIHQGGDALAQIAEILTTYGIPADRHVAVLSLALQAHAADADWRDPAIRSLLVEAGADVAMAQQIHRGITR